MSNKLRDVYCIDDIYNVGRCFRIYIYGQVLASLLDPVIDRYNECETCLPIVNNGKIYGIIVKEVGTFYTRKCPFMYLCMTRSFYPSYVKRSIVFDDHGRNLIINKLRKFLNISEYFFQHCFKTNPRLKCSVSLGHVHISLTFGTYNYEQLYRKHGLDRSSYRKFIIITKRNKYVYLRLYKTKGLGIRKLYSYAMKIRDLLNNSAKCIHCFVYKGDNSVDLLIIDFSNFINFVTRAIARKFERFCKAICVRPTLETSLLTVILRCGYDYRIVRSVELKEYVLMNELDKIYQSLKNLDNF